MEEGCEAARVFFIDSELHGAEIHHPSIAASSVMSRLVSFCLLCSARCCWACSVRTLSQGTKSCILAVAAAGKDAEGTRHPEGC